MLDRNRKPVEAIGRTITEEMRTGVLLADRGRAAPEEDMGMGAVVMAKVTGKPKLRSYEVECRL